METQFGAQSMVGTLKKVLVKKPDSGFSRADPALWHYSEKPDLDRALSEHQDFINILSHYGTEVYFLPPLETLADSIYVHDPSLVTNKGAILLKMGKPLREEEVQAHKEFYQAHDIPVLGQLSGEATAEAGDLLWLDPETLVAGVGFRTNYQAVEQLHDILKPLGVTVIPVELPYYLGPEACLHLMSFISMIDHDLAVGYLKLMPVPFWQILKAREIEIVEVPEEEFLTMGPNVLAIKPRICLILEGNDKTRAGLEAKGCTVHTYRGNEISLKCEGGATCLTRPILRH